MPVVQIAVAVGEVPLSVSKAVHCCPYLLLMMMKRTRRQFVVVFRLRFLLFAIRAVVARCRGGCRVRSA